MNRKQFQKTIWEFYQKNKRDLPWRREPFDAYSILISEIMLQQTQVKRVIPKYEAFLKKFPTFESLAKSSIHDVLAMWSGLGYNRRALYLKKTAEYIYEKNNSTLPSQFDQLLKLPGIGKNTAGSIIAFACNKPTVFIETNIRTVFLHFFFKDKDNVDDKAILELVEKSLDLHNAREWYYALMDYGAYLKSITKNKTAKQSKHYSIQSKFKGSNRELRGKILKFLLHNKIVTLQKLEKEFFQDKYRLQNILDELLQEGFIKNKSEKYFLE